MVYELNQQASKYVETLALLYANFERICTEKKEVEEQFDRDFAAHEATGVKFCNAFREVCNRRAIHEVICVEAREGAA